VQSLIDRVTAVFVPVVLSWRFWPGALWLFLGADPSRALVVTVSVLIIACPCAMGLATPVSILAGTGRAAELGVLFRQGSALQAPWASST
jgi:Cu+-exporting ATPase